MPLTSRSSSVERSPQLTFFGGYLAAPGGTLDPVDRVPGPDGTPEPNRGLEGAGDEFDLAHARCAARELFEETGVLLPAIAARLPPSARADVRRRLLAGEVCGSWRAATRGLTVPDYGFEVLGRITTPPFSPLVHCTYYLHLALPDGERPEVLAGELTGGRFARPGQLVEHWLAGRLLIVPPVLRMLALAAGHGRRAWLALLVERMRALSWGTLAQIQNTPGIWIAPLQTPTLPPATTTNAYVVGNERLYVVDPATYDRQERERLAALLDELRQAGRRLAGVLVTHHHPRSRRGRELARTTLRAAGLRSSADPRTVAAAGGRCACPE